MVSLMAAPPMPPGFGGGPCGPPPKMSWIYSTVTPASSTTVFQLANSLAMNALNSSGLPPSISAPRVSAKLTKASLAMTWSSASDRVAITAASVPDGASRPNHDRAANPSSSGISSSSSVGTPSSFGDRSGVVTAKARNAPDSICGMAEGRLSNITSTSPASNAGTASPLPRNGTWVMFAPVRDLNISPDRWIELPTPDDPKVLPSALAASRNSPAVWNGLSLLTTITLGMDINSLIGAKSATGSYCRFL